MNYLNTAFYDLKISFKRQINPTNVRLVVCDRDNALREAENFPSRKVKYAFLYPESVNAAQTERN